MPVVASLAITLVTSGSLAVILVRAPRVGLGHHPRAGLIIAALALGLVAAVVLIQVGAVLAFDGGRSLRTTAVTNYYLAMANRLLDGPYPFFWTPPWMYPVGTLTPLLPLGSAVALAASLSGRRQAPRVAIEAAAIAGLFLTAYVLAGAYAAANTWLGVPL